MQRAASVSLGDADDVVNSLFQVGRVLRQRLLAEGLAPGSYPLLQQVEAAGTVRVSELAGITGLDASTVSRHVSHLERAGLLTRSPDPADGRAQRVGLSPTGAQHLRESLDQRRRVITDSLRHWDPRDVATLAHLLQQFGRDVAPHTAEADQEIR